MGTSNDKGDLGEIKVLLDLIGKGYKISIPYGHDCAYDLMADKDGDIKRVQVKYTDSNNEVVKVRCMSTSQSRNYGYKYTEKDIDIIAVYDVFTNTCYYIPSDMLGEGRNTIRLRVSQPKNNQEKNVLWAKDFTTIKGGNTMTYKHFAEKQTHL